MECVFILGEISMFAFFWLVPELAKSLLVYNFLYLSVIFPPLFYLRNQLIYEEALFMVNGNFLIEVTLEISDLQFWVNFRLFKAA